MVFTPPQPTVVLANRFSMGREFLRCRFSALHEATDLQSRSPVMLCELNRQQATSDPRVLEQFRREGHLLRRLAHRNLPQVLDAGEDGSRLFLVMQPFDGHSAQYVVEHLSGAPREQLLVEWLDQAADALDYLHKQEPPVIYRNLCPESLVITEANVLKLVDFGLARIADTGGQAKTMMRGMGEEDYAPLEQLEGQPSSVQSDLYSLGATFFRLAGGGPPPSCMARATGTRLPDLRTVNPHLSSQFVSIIEELMNLAAQDRPVSALIVRQFLRDLANVSLEPLPAAVVPVLRSSPSTTGETLPAPPLHGPTTSPRAESKSFLSGLLPWFVKRKLPTSEPQKAAAPQASDSQAAFIDLGTLQLDRNIGQLVSWQLARRLNTVCIGRPTPKELTLAVKSADVYIYDDIAYTTRGAYRATLLRADPALIELAQEYIYKLPESLQSVSWPEWLAQKKFESEKVDVIVADDQRPLLGVVESKGPAIEAVDRMIKEAISIGASDIHVETYEKEVVLRYRIDGILHLMNTWQREEASGYIKRLKVMANMDITQDLVPQGGRISVRVSDKAYDLRISCLPVADGENVVLRLLPKGTFNVKLNDLGFDEDNLERFRRAVSQPHGMIIVSGPTGSGKSTTLYAALGEINRPDRKVLTVEDPIEYKLPGVSQVQVNMAPREDDKKLTFARALREFLRQDPDVILVGEIRDAETAAIAVQASLTGHLLLSTLHTNTSIGIVTRLADMGVEPYLLSSTLLAGIAQRLVRKICEGCKQQVPVPPEVIPLFEKNGVPPTRMFRGAGCTACHRTGYKGRVAVYEVLEVQADLRPLIATGALEADMYAVAKRAGLMPILTAGLHKVEQGLTTIEEVQRVCLQ